MNYKIGMLKVAVSDLKLSTKFYETNLGFESVFVLEEYGWSQMKNGDLAFALYVPGLGGGEKEPGGSTDFHLVLTPDEFDPLAKRLLEEGLLSEGIIHTGDDDSTFIDVLDPDQNIVRIARLRG